MLHHVVRNKWQVAILKYDWSFKKKCSNCNKRHEFQQFQGVYVLIGGFYGSHLRKKGTNSLFLDSIFHSKSTECTFEQEEMEAVGIIDKFGGFDYCSRLCSEFESASACSKVKFYKFAYDWTRELQENTREFIKFIEEIGEKATVVSHSMGGLVTLAAVNKRPELFKKCVFVGCPFHSAPVILWGFNRGAPTLINQKVFGAAQHINYRSGFAFLPRDTSRILVNDNGYTDIDLWDPSNWPLISPAFSQQDCITDILKEKVEFSLKRAAEFRKDYEFNPKVKYPEFIIVQSDKWPTPVSFKYSLHNNRIRLTRPFEFVKGDGVVPLDSMQMPRGYTFSVVSSMYPHPWMLNDTNAILEAIKSY